MAASPTTATRITGVSAKREPEKKLPVRRPQTTIRQSSRATRGKACRRPHLPPAASGSGRSRQAAAIISGYSKTLLKTNGATRAVSSPPTTPPSDIQR